LTIYKNSINIVIKRKKVMKAINLKRSKVCVFARHLFKNNKMTDWGEAMRKAWAYFNANLPGELVEITSTKGVTSKRVVDFNWRKYYTPKGNGHPLKEGQTMMIDMAKYQANIRPIITTYQYRKIG
jgi:hypothetical protein